MFVLIKAALFDLIGTSLNYVGMILSYPSSFQMLRGTGSRRHGSFSLFFGKNDRFVIKTTIVFKKERFLKTKKRRRLLVLVRRFVNKGRSFYSLTFFATVNDRQKTFR